MGRTTGPSSRFRALVAVADAIVTGRARRFEIAEHSMRPTLRDGDWVMATTRTSDVGPGDVVVLDHPLRPGFELVKRIHAIDGAGLTVLGDDPAAGSVDSVTFGRVDPAAVRARVLLRYKPWPPQLVR